MPDPRTDRLLALLKQFSWMEREQEFTLASGRKSRFYIDARLTTLHPEGSRLVGELIYDVLKGTAVEAIGGMATAAIPMVTSVALVSSGTPRPLPAFYVRDQAKEHGTQRVIEGQFPARPGAQVALVEDTMTTGGSLLQAIERVEEAGVKVAKVVILVDRREGGSERLREMGYDVVALFHVPGEGRLEPATEMPSQ